MLAQDGIGSALVEVIVGSRRLDRRRPSRSSGHWPTATRGSGSSPCRAAARRRPRRALFEAARGEVVVLTDAETRFAPGCLAALAEALRDPRVGCVTGRLEWRDEAATATSTQRGAVLALRAARSRAGEPGRVADRGHRRAAGGPPVGVPAGAADGLDGPPPAALRPRGRRARRLRPGARSPRTGRSAGCASSSATGPGPRRAASGRTSRWSGGSRHGGTRGRRSRSGRTSCSAGRRRGSCWSRRAERAGAWRSAARPPTSSAPVAVVIGRGPGRPARTCSSGPAGGRRVSSAFARSFAVVNIAFALGWVNVVRGREIEVWHRAEWNARL